MSLASQIQDLATRIATEFNTIREEIDLAAQMYPVSDGYLTVPRTSAITNQGLLTSGRQSFTAIYLPAGFTVNYITLHSGSTGAGTPTNQIFSIYSSARARLAVTANNTTTAWAAGSTKKLQISGGYTIPTSGLYYVGCMVSATTVPNLVGWAVSQNAIAAISPRAMFEDATNTGLTTTLPATASFGNANQGFWAQLSAA